MSDWRWLESTRKLQLEAYGFDAEKMSPTQRASSIKENVLAAMVELVELLGNVSWKYWAHDETFIDRGEVLKEAVDVGHFLGNILTAIGVTDEEYEEAYREKQAINRQRQLEGYKVKEKA